MTHGVSVWLTPEGERYAEETGIEPRGGSEFGMDRVTGRES